LLVHPIPSVILRLTGPRSLMRGPSPSLRPLPIVNALAPGQFN
jgi:hypothetical protein